MSTRSVEAIQRDLRLKYQNIDATGIGDAGGLRGSVVPGSYFLALMTASAEADYGGYARQPIARSVAGFTLTNVIMSNINQVNFPKATSGSNLITRVALFTALTGGTQDHIQTQPNPITVSTNVTPYIEAGTLAITGS
jgi:hypothetical protein